MTLRLVAHNWRLRELYCDLPTGSVVPCVTLLSTMPNLIQHVLHRTVYALTNWCRARFADSQSSSTLSSVNWHCYDVTVQVASDSLSLASPYRGEVTGLLSSEREGSEVFYLSDSYHLCPFQPVVYPFGDSPQVRLLSSPTVRPGCHTSVYAVVHTDHPASTATMCQSGGLASTTLFGSLTQTACCQFEGLTPTAPFGSRTPTALVDSQTATALSAMLHTLIYTSQYIVLLHCPQAFFLWRQSFRTLLDRLPLATAL